jgi:hypothetical protein
LTRVRSLDRGNGTSPLARSNSSLTRPQARSAAPGVAPVTVSRSRGRTSPFERPARPRRPARRDRPPLASPSSRRSAAATAC